MPDADRIRYKIYKVPYMKWARQTLADAKALTASNSEGAMILVFAVLESAAYLEVSRDPSMQGPTKRFKKFIRKYGTATLKPLEGFLYGTLRSNLSHTGIRAGLTAATPLNGIRTISLTVPVTEKGSRVYIEGDTVSIGTADLIQEVQATLNAFDAAHKRKQIIGEWSSYRCHDCNMYFADKYPPKCDFCDETLSVVRDVTAP